MKAIYPLVLMFISSLSYALPSHNIVQLQLSKGEQETACPASLEGATVIFEYNFNFERNEGQAFLRKIKSTAWDVTLFPLGLSSSYTFMSDMQPTTIEIDNEPVVISQIIFELDKDGKTSATLKIGEEPDVCVMNSVGG